MANLGVGKAALHERVDRHVAYHPPGTLAKPAHELVRRATAQYAHMLIDICPEGRELSLTLTKLIDETMAHANAAIARNHEGLSADSIRYWTDRVDEW